MNDIDEEKKEVTLREIAEAAAKLDIRVDRLESILGGIRKVPEQMQQMVDNVVAIQNDFPMPEGGWKQFLKDIEYTNEKHGLDLRIKSELLEK